MHPADWYSTEMTPETFLTALADIAEGAKSNRSSSSFFLNRLREHFDADPRTLPILTENFKLAEHPNLHLAVEAYLAAPEMSASLLGFTSEQDRYVGLRINDLLVSGEHAPVEGPVQYRNIELDEGQVLACVHKGLFLIRSGGSRLAVLVRGPSRDFQPSLDLDVMANARPDAEAFLAEIRRSMKKKSVYRGKVLTLQAIRDGMEVQIRKLPKVERDQIILQAGLLERIERQTIRFSKHAEQLRASGRHLRRGVLLYGPPGTGKTLSAMYLASQMPERTVLLVTGRSMGLINEVCAMARALQPATVVLEDIDLVAEQNATERELQCRALRAPERDGWARRRRGHSLPFDDQSPRHPRARTCSPSGSH